MPKEKMLKKIQRMLQRKKKKTQEQELREVSYLTINLLYWFYIMRIIVLWKLNAWMWHILIQSYKSLTVFFVFYYFKEINWNLINETVNPKMKYVIYIFCSWIFIFSFDFELFLAVTLKYYVNTIYVFYFIISSSKFTHCSQGLFRWWLCICF